MVTEQEIKSQYALLRIMVLALMLVFPVAYLVVIYYMIQGGGIVIQSQVQLFYPLLALALIQGLVIPFVEKKVTASYVTRRLAGKGLLEAAQTICIVKMSLIESVYIYGFVTVLTSGTATMLPYFYGLGILYTVVYWPSESRFTELVRKLEVS